MVSMMLFPVVYLLILGNALNHQLRAIPIAIVNEAGNALSAECVRAAMALESGRDLLRITPVADREEALRGLRQGKFRAVWVLPPGLSRQGPAPSFIGDNTDRFSFDTVADALRDIWDNAASGGSTRIPRRCSKTTRSPCRTSRTAIRRRRLVPRCRTCRRS